MTLNVCGRVYPGPVVVFVVFFRSPLSFLFCFIKVLVIMSISLLCFADEEEGPYADKIYVNTVNFRYNDRIHSQRCCHHNEFAVVKNP